MKEPKIGLALGSGGAKGFAHIGVIKVLREAGIPIHMIAGSSMGALIGTFYAASSNVERLYKLASVLSEVLFRFHGTENGIYCWKTCQRYD